MKNPKFLLPKRATLVEIPSPHHGQPSYMYKIIDPHHGIDKNLGKIMLNKEGNRKFSKYNRLGFHQSRDQHGFKYPSIYKASCDALWVEFENAKNYISTYKASIITETKLHPDCRALRGLLRRADRRLKKLQRLAEWGDMCRECSSYRKASEIYSSVNERRCIYNGSKCSTETNTSWAELRLVPHKLDSYDREYPLKNGYLHKFCK